MPSFVQNSYTLEHAVAFPGMEADINFLDIISKNVETAAIPYGLAVVQGTEDNQGILPSEAGQEFLGVSQRALTGVANASGVAEYAVNSSVNIFRLGRIWVTCEDSCAPGDPLYFRHTTGTGTVIGSFRTDSDTNTCDRVKGATIRTTASAGALALVQLEGDQTNDSLLSTKETITAVNGAVSVATSLTMFDTTLGAGAYTLADGVEGQVKTLKMTVDGGNAVITPVNLLEGTILTLFNVGDSIDLVFIDTVWMIKASTLDDYLINTIDTVTASTGAVSLITKATLFDTTSGVATYTLADGIEGQVKTLKKVAAGNSAVITPANLLDGTSVTLYDIWDAIDLMFTGGTWMIKTNTVDRGHINTVETVTTSGAVSLDTQLTVFDSTSGIQANTLANGVEGQRKLLKMTADGGNSVLTPASFFDGTTLTFDDVNDSAELFYYNSAWNVLSLNGATVA